MPEEKIDHFLSTYNAPLNILVGITNGCTITLTSSSFVGLAETEVGAKVDWNGGTFVWSDRIKYSIWADSTSCAVRELAG